MNGTVARSGAALRAAYARIPAWGWAAVAMLLAALDLSGHILVGWIAHDEGALAMGARLVRGGAWPHRDFSDIYTGGLAVVGAGAQVLLGDDLRAMRILFFACAIGWVGLLAVTLRRFLPPAGAAAAALAAYAWGPPLYAAAMPSWFLLFLTTLLLWCLLRWQASAARRWLFLAGATVGVGLLIKINALFLLAGAGCALLLPLAPEVVVEDRGWGGWARLALAAAGVSGALALLGTGWPIGRTLGVALPLLILTLIGGTVAVRGGDRSAGAVRRVSYDLVALLGGVLAIAGPWILAYLLVGAGEKLLIGVFELPFRRIALARVVPPAFRWFDLVVTALLLVAMRVGWRGRDRRLVPLLLLAGLVALLAAAQASGWLAVWRTWHVARVLGPVLVIAGALHASGRRDDLAARGLGVLAWLTAWLAMIQYPFAAPVYFAYVAPLMVAMGAALMVAWATQRGVAAVIGGSALVLAIAFGHGDSVGALGHLRDGARAMVPLPGPHGGIRVPTSDSAQYAGILTLLDQWQAERIVAGPDAPEVYYLSGRTMLDREFFEFFAPDWSPGLLAARARAHRAQALVLNTQPGFSSVTVDSVVRPLMGHITQDTLLGHFLLLRLDWTDASP